jgi:hypothetical protein
LAVQRRTASPGKLHQEARYLITQAEKALPGTVGRSREAVACAALYAGYLAADTGDRETAERARALAAPVIASAPQPVLANMSAIVAARLALQAGDRPTALALLGPFQGPSALALTGSVLAEARPGRAPAAITPAERARAYGEWAAERPPVLEVLAGPVPVSGRRPPSR